MADFTTTEFFTPREQERLIELVADGHCALCECSYDDEASANGECPNCGNWLIPYLELGGVECDFCHHVNPLPKPLDHAFACQGCGKHI